MKKYIVFLILLISICGGYYIKSSIYKPHHYDMELTIKKGVPLITQLKKIQIDTIPLKIYLKYRNGGRNIKAGSYKIVGDYNYPQLINILEKGHDKLVKFTVPEGYTVSQIADILVNDFHLSRDKFYKALNNVKDFPYLVPNGNYEGYLYPNTYLLPDGFDEKKAVKAMLEQFVKIFPPNKYKDKNKFYKKLIMASIIQREAVIGDEKPIIASVFYNRIKKNMTLSSDATVNFLYDYKKKRIFYKDLKKDSPYNTYIYKGLPPAPICNPDRASVMAAINPADTDYLFFVASNGGHHHFSKTYREHLNFQRTVKKK